jgi:hypothetical protein
MTTLDASDDKDLGQTTRSKGDQAESRAGDVGVSPSFAARLRAHWGLP